MRSVECDVCGDVEGPWRYGVEDGEMWFICETCEREINAVA